MIRCGSGSERRGAVTPLAAILAIPLMGLLAFSLDIAYIVLVQAELQNAADAAALAAVDQMKTPYSTWANYGTTAQQQASDISGGEINARSTAAAVALANRAAGRSIALDAQNDVTFGFSDSTGVYNPNPTAAQYPNTVQVTVRFDGGTSTNAKLKLFFGPVLGLNEVSLTATARATLYTGDFSNLDSGVGINAHILPVAVYQSDWNNYFATGALADTNPAPNGRPQFQIYPGSGAGPGSNGLLSLAGESDTNRPDYTDWIYHGPSPSNMANLIQAKNLPLNGSQTDWWAGPGMKSSDLTSFQDMRNKPVLLPLFDNAGGNGSNAWYHIVAFVAVNITYADGTGNNMDIAVQPASVTDPTVIVGNAVPAGTGASNTFIFTASKLTN